MAYQSNEKKGPSGGLWINKDKVAGSNQPDKTGKVELTRELVKELVDQLNDGNEYGIIRLAGWDQVSGSGSNWTNVKASSITPPNKGQRTAPQPNTQSPPPPETEVNDKIPF